MLSIKKLSGRKYTTKRSVIEILIKPSVASIPGRAIQADTFSGIAIKAQGNGNVKITIENGVARLIRNWRAL